MSQDQVRALVLGTSVLMSARRSGNAGPLMRAMVLLSLGLTCHSHLWRLSCHMRTNPLPVCLPISSLPLSLSHFNQSRLSYFCVEPALVSLSLVLCCGVGLRLHHQATNHHHPILKFPLLPILT